MCGIVGMVSTKASGFDTTESEVFSELLYADRLRGEDSTGAFMVNRDANVEFLKAANDAPTFLKTTEYRSFISDVYQRGRMVVGHNRKATKGVVSDENAHPFVEENTILVHNGTVFNHAALATEQVAVDSHAILHGIVEHGADQTLTAINGAYALVWYDTDAKTLFLARNKERPLFVANAPGAWYFASEKEMLAWILARNKITVKDWTELTPGFIYRFEHDDRTWMKNKKILTKRKEAQTTSVVLRDTFRTRQNSASNDSAADFRINQWPKLIEERKEKASKGSSTRSVETNSTPASGAGKESERGGGKGDLVNPRSFRVGSRYTVSLSSVHRTDDSDPKIIGYALGTLHFLPEIECRVWFKPEDKELLDLCTHDLSSLITASHHVAHLNSKGFLKALHLNKPEPLVSIYDTYGNEVFPDDFVMYQPVCILCKKPIIWNEVSKASIKVKRDTKQMTCFCGECLNNSTPAGEQ